MISEFAARDEMLYRLNYELIVTQLQVLKDQVISWYWDTLLCFVTPRIAKANETVK